jgi:ABC-type amino acid transport system permease subunit
VAPEWILNSPEWWEDFCFRIYKCFLFDNRYEMYLTGLRNTLLMTAFALLMGVVLGIVVSLIRVTWDKNGEEMQGGSKVVLRILNAISQVYLTVIRGTPAVVQLLIWWFVIFPSSRNGMMVASIAFGINSGAYVAEIFRGGILAVDKGQMEAARSLGLTQWQGMKFVVLPQAIKNILPALANEVITMVKESSICSTYGMMELMWGAKTVAATTYVTLGPYVLAAIIYFCVNFPASKAIEAVERRMRRGDNQ